MWLIQPSLKHLMEGILKVSKIRGKGRETLSFADPLPLVRTGVSTEPESALQQRTPRGAIFISPVLTANASPLCLTHLDEESRLDKSREPFLFDDFKLVFVQPDGRRVDSVVVFVDVLGIQCTLHA
jgi:hypothetical protein